MSGLTVVDLWRYPVKSLLGERLSSAAVGAHGLVGDRVWSLVDTERNVNLTARRRPELLLASARLAGDHPADGVVITLPDGTETAADDVLSDWLGRPITLVSAAEHRSGTFETQADETETGPWFRWEGPSGSFHDSARTMVSLVSTSTLGPWDRRRFRINVILDGQGEDELVEHTVTLGGVTLEVCKRIDRCVMTTRPQAAADGKAALERDLDVFKTISRERDGFLGIGAVVRAGGTISLGDAVVVG